METRGGNLHHINTEPVHVLWTSGWDSTYRVLDAVLNRQLKVQPWYVIDPDRRSRQIELDTMDAIRAELNLRDTAAGSRLLSTRFRRRRDIPEDAEISAAFKQLPGPGRWGPQYEWLARLAKSEQVRLEIGLKADDGPIQRLSAYLHKDPESGSYVLTPPAGHPARTIFSRFDLPLVELSKLDMQQLARQNGFLDLLEMTWFCQHPTLRGEACGLCIPCQHYREEGLERRLPPKPGVAQRVEFLLVNKSWGLFTRARAIGRRVLVRG